MEDAASKATSSISVPIKYHRFVKLGLWDRIRILFGAKITFSGLIYVSKTDNTKIRVEHHHLHINNGWPRLAEAVEDGTSNPERC